MNEIAPALLMSDMVRRTSEARTPYPWRAVIARLAVTQVDQPEDGAPAVLVLCSEQAKWTQRRAADPQGPRVAAAPVGVGQTLTEQLLDAPLAIG